MDRLQYMTLHSRIKNDQPFIIIDDSINLIAAVMTKSTNGEPLYLIQLEIDKEKLEESLKSINMYEESEIFLVSEGKQIISSSSKASEQIVQPYLSYIYERDEGEKDFF